MQDSQIVTNNVEKKVGLESTEWIRKLPEELVGLIPDSVWGSLSLDQKKEILRQNGILEKYITQSVQPNSENVTAEQVQSPAEVLPSTTPESISQSPVVEQSQNVSKESQEFASLVDAVKKEELDVQKNSPLDTKPKDLTSEEKDRIAQETLTVNNQTFKLGYQVSDDTVANSEKLSKEGDVSDGKTWAATLWSKIFAIFGE